MIEIPEAATLASQLTTSVAGRQVTEAIAGHSPHKWAWFHGEPGSYDALLRGRTVGESSSHGGFVDIPLEGAHLAFAEGISLRLHGPDNRRPEKHQLLVSFDDGSFLTASVRMYGGLWAFAEGSFDNPYYAAAKEAPSPLDNAFDASRFAGLLGAPGAEKLSLKALLATEQRVPGLGNGVLQDILFAARLHPRRRVATLTPDEESRLFDSVKSTLADMTRQGGRDTEQDLHGHPGGYRTRLSRHTVGRPCPRCGDEIAKAQYLGGSVYFCATCQAP